MQFCFLGPDRLRLCEEPSDIAQKIMSALGFSVAGVFLGACAGYCALIFKRRLGVIFEALSAGVLLFVVLTAIYAFMNFVPAPHA